MRERYLLVPPGYTPPQALRFKRAPGKPYVPDVVDRVRVLAEGTNLPLTGIAARTGVGATTIHQWIHRRGWKRPAAASCSTRSVALARAGFTRRLRHALARVEALAARELTQLEETGRPADIGRARALVETAHLARTPPRKAVAPPRADGRGRAGRP